MNKPQPFKILIALFVLSQFSFIIEASDPDPWWDTRYLYRQRVTVTNGVSDDVLITGYSVKVTFNHQTLVSGGKSLTSGDDVRVVFWDGSSFTELDRATESNWNSTTTDIWFKLVDPIQASGTDNHYYIYYGNSSAGSPPANRSNIYLWHDDFTTDTLSNYIQGRFVDFVLDNPGTGSGSMTHNVGGYAQFTDTNHINLGLRIESISAANLLISCNIFITSDDANDNMLALGLSWTNNSSAYYGFYSTNGAVDSGIEEDSNYTGSVATSTQTLAESTDLRLMYAIYDGNHKLWYNTHDTSAGTIASGTDTTHGAGNPFFQVSESAGRIDNLLVRHYMSPEPSSALGSEEDLADYKVTITHPFTASVSASEQDIVILRLDVATGASDNITQLLFSGNNTNNNDVSSVSAYYTGTSTLFETTVPFGAQNQAIASANFIEDRILPDYSLVHFFITYNVSGSATNNNVLDAYIPSANVTISTNTYPSSFNINASGNRSIEAPQTLGTITVTNSSTGNVVQGSGNQEILRIAIPVTGTGAPQTVNSITISGNNSNSGDVDSVSCFYTGTSSTFATNVYYGAKDQAFVNNEVTFTAPQDLDVANSTHYFFIAYNINELAIDGATVDAMIVGANVVLEGSGATPTDGDPSGSRTIYIPTGNVSSLGPSSYTPVSNPSFDPSRLTPFGDVTHLSSDNQNYAGVDLEARNLFDPQEVYVTFDYDLSPYSIDGSDIVSLAFSANMFLRGDVAITSGTLNGASVAELDKVYESTIDIYNHATGTWENLYEDFIQPISSGWEGTVNATRWDQTADDNPATPLGATKTDGWTDDYLDANKTLKIRIYMKIDFTAQWDECVIHFDKAAIDFSYGSVFEQTSFRWTDEGEAPVANEDSTFEASTNQKLHLRVGTRITRKAKPTHYLALQYDDNSSFTSPELITTTTGNLQMWDDTGQSEGSTIGSTVLSNTPTASIYHEDNIPPGQTKDANTIYEEDFTIQGIANGTWYIRTVEVGADGTFLNLLDTYNTDIVLTVSTPSDNLEAYDWTVDDGGAEEWGGDNTALEFSPSTNYILAIRVDRTSGSSDFNWQLQYQENPFTNPGQWTNVTTTSDKWKAVNTNRAGTAVDLTPDAATAAGTGTAQDSTLAQDGVVNLSGFATGEYTELWYSLQSTADTANNAYRFRVTNDGISSGINFDTYPVAKNSTLEQVSFRWTDDAEVALETESSGGNVAVNQQTHLRVGLRANHSTVSDNYFALLVDADNDGNFSTGGNYLLTTSSSNIIAWDDSDHGDGDQMSSTKLLSSSSNNGLYHEDENQPSSQSLVADLLYEDDFTIQPTVAGNYYLRVVKVDSSGANPVALDTYTKEISIQASTPSLTQACFRWALDAASPSFDSSDNTTRDFAVGTKYILAVQIENGGLQTTPSWQLQYQKINGTPGSWTNVTASSSHWKGANGVYNVDTNNISAGTFVCNSGNATTSGYASDAGIYSETGSFSDALGNNSYTEYWFVLEADSNAENNSYRFRLTDGGSISNFTYDSYALAAKVHSEQVSFRWADSDEVALFNENTAATVAVDQQLHLRVGIRSNYGAMAAHYLAIQADTNSGFTDPWTVTTLSSNVATWDDGGHNNGDTVSGSKILSGSPTGGLYHENGSQPNSQTKTGDTIYEEDFTIKFTTAGNYYLRAVTVDSSGNNASALDVYTQAIEAQASVPSLAQSGYEWASDTAIPDFSGSDNIALTYDVSNNYVLAFRFENSGLAATTNNNWTVQYQKDPTGTPGPWTTISTTSSDWKAINGLTGNDQDAIVVSASGNALSAVGGLNNSNGVYSENNDTGAIGIVSGNVFTEFWYAIQPQEDAAGSSYRFRITNSGSSFGIQYNVYGTASANVTGPANRRGVIFFHGLSF